MAFDADDRAIFTLKLPIHNEARSVAQVPAVIAALEECEQARCLKQSDSYKRTRVYFLLDRQIELSTMRSGHARKRARKRRISCIATSPIAGSTRS